MLSGVSHHGTLAAPIDGDEFSSSKTASFLIDEIENAQFFGVERPNNSFTKAKPSDLVLEFPIVPLLDLPLQEILEVRKLQPLIELRAALANYRRTSGIENHVDIDLKLWRLFDAVGEYLSAYLSQNKIQRQLSSARLPGKVETRRHQEEARLPCPGDCCVGAGSSRSRASG